MEYLIKEVDTSKRSVLVLSENYTLTRTEGLKLFQIEFVHDTDEDGYQWLSEPVEFWACSKVLALETLQTNVKTFLAYGLTAFSSTENPISDQKVMAWVNHYVNTSTLCQGLEGMPMIYRAVEENNHWAYVLKKMIELVDALHCATLEQHKKLFF